MLNLPLGRCASGRCFATDYCHVPNKKTARKGKWQRDSDPAEGVRTDPNRRGIANELSLAGSRGAAGPALFPMQTQRRYSVNRPSFSVPEPRRDGRALVVNRLQLRECRLGDCCVLAGPAVRVAGHQAEAPVAHGEQAQEAVRGGEDVEIGLGEFAIDVQVAQGVLLVARLALERKVEGGPDNAVRALGADEPGRLRLLQPAVRVAQ